MKNGFTVAEGLITFLVLSISIISFFGYKNINTFNNAQQKNVEGHIRFEEEDCKIQSIDITSKGVSIKCKI